MGRINSVMVSDFFGEAVGVGIAAAGYFFAFHKIKNSQRTNSC